MEQFLDMFGGVSVTIAQLAGLGVIIFSAYGAGKKAKEYFSEKKKTIIEKARAEHDKDEEWQKIASQVAQYPSGTTNRSRYGMGWQNLLMVWTLRSTRSAVP